MPESNRPSHNTNASHSQDEKARYADPSLQRSSGQTDLSHFKRAADNIPVRKKGVNKFVKREVTDTFKSVFKRNGVSIKTRLREARDALWARAQKYIIRIGIAIAAVLLIVAAINAPAQILRSQAFGLYDERQFVAAIEEFHTYLEKRPHDDEALLYAAMAATRVADFGLANQLVRKIADTDLENTPDYLFLRALLSDSSEKSIELLNQLLLQDSTYIEGRFLRAVLLGSNREFRRARDDFLQADSLIRSRRDFDSTKLQAVHARIISNDSFLSVFEPTRSSQPNDLWQSLSRHLNIPISDNLYANLYVPALPDNLVKSEIEDDGIIGIYYAIMLLQAGEINEANVEFSKLPELLMNNSEIGTLSGVRDAILKQYTAAEEKFATLSDILPDDSIVFFNLANAAFQVNPSRTNLTNILNYMNQAIDAGLALPAGYHNRACLHLMLGNFEDAFADAQTAMQKGGLPQTSLILALSALSVNPQDEKIADYLKAVANKKSPTYVSAKLLYEFANGNYQMAFENLQKHIARNDENSALYAQMYANFLTRDGLLMRARNALNIARKNSRGDSQIYYQLARNALALNDTERARAQISLISKIPKQRALANAVLGGIILRKNPQQGLQILQQATEDANDDTRRQIVADFADTFFAEDIDTLRTTFSSIDDTLSPIETAVLARLQAIDGNTTIALSLVQSAQQRDSSWPVLYHAGIAAGQSGDTKTAISLLQMARTLSPANLDILSQLHRVEKIAESSNALITQQTIDNIKRMNANPNTKENEEPQYKLIFPQDARLSATIVLAAREQIKNNRTNGDTPPSDALQTKIESVLTRFDSLLESQPDNAAEIYLQRGTFWMTMYDYASASKDFELAWETATDKSPLKKQIGNYLAKSRALEKRYGEVAEVYQQLGEDYPQFSLYRRLAGQALARAKKTQESEDYLLKTLDLFPTDHKTYFILVTEVYKNREDSGKIINVLRQAARAIPNYAPIYQSLSRALVADDLEAAKENSTILSFLTPENNP